VILAAHGGGYVVGSMYSHRKLYAHVAKAVGCRALVVHYGRAPENIHPGPVNDMTRSYNWLLGSGIRANHIPFIPDSPRRRRAVATALRVRDRDLPLPGALLVLSPWVDMTASGETFETNRGNDVLITREIISDMADTFLGLAGNRNDPLASPVFADLGGCPPL